MTARSKLSINLPGELLTTIDKVRGDIPRSLYIQRAVEKYLIISKLGLRRSQR